MKDPEMVPGTIKLEEHLPEVFKNQEVRDLALQSLNDFKAHHGGELPMKFRIEEFCFNRTEQICTTDSERKYMAWAGDDIEIARRIFEGLVDEDIPLVLRAHPIEYGMASPTMQVLDFQELRNHTDFLQGAEVTSAIQTEFFDRIESRNTVVQLIKNAYPQAGLFLVRPTFVYDHALRNELRTYQSIRGPQYVTGTVGSLENMPEELVGLRVIPLSAFAREKKTRMGALFVFNPESGTLEARDGFPQEAKWQTEDAWKDSNRGLPTGRTLDLTTSATTLHHHDDVKRSTPDSTFVNPSDIEFLSKVLAWQMPRIANFEDKIHEQDWIPQGLTSTHQFIVFPPQELGGNEVNTQYFDFRAHVSREEMDSLSEDKRFEELSPEEKFKRFF